MSRFFTISKVDFGIIGRYGVFGSRQVLIYFQKIMKAGDVNKDDVINVETLHLAYYYLVSEGDPDWNLQSADVNNDGL